MKLKNEDLLLLKKTCDDILDRHEDVVYRMSRKKENSKISTDDTSVKNVMRFFNQLNRQDRILVLNRLYDIARLGNKSASRILKVYILEVSNEI